jgi:asparagine synthase (glutamine-hydrolysing)
MAHSLETRIPFLDYRLIEFMCTVDKDIKLQGWERKSVLRNTIGRTLPAELMNAPKKGFGIPLREWFKKGDFSNIFDENMGVLNSILDKKSISNIINDNNAGLGDHGNFIWTLLMLNKALK